jgi:hypothetical protein
MDAPVSITTLHHGQSVVVKSEEAAAQQDRDAAAATTSTGGAGTATTKTGPSGGGSGPGTGNGGIGGGKGAPPPRKTLPAKEFHIFRAKVRLLAQTAEAVNRDQWQEANIECPLLVDNSCSVHQLRPLACVGWSSTDALDCRRARGHVGPLVAFFAPQWRICTEMQAGIGEVMRIQSLQANPVELVTALYEVWSVPKLWTGGSKGDSSSTGQCVLWPPIPSYLRLNPECTPLRRPPARGRPAARLAGLVTNSRQPTAFARNSNLNARLNPAWTRSDSRTRSCLAIQARIARTAYTPIRPQVSSR